VRTPGGRRADWESPLDGGKFRAQHTIDIAFAFDNVRASRLTAGAPADLGVDAGAPRSQPRRQPGKTGPRSGLKSPNRSVLAVADRLHLA